MFSFDAQKYKWFNLQLKIYYKINAVFFIFQSLRFGGFLLSLQSIMDRMGWRIKTSGYGSDKPFDIHKQRTVEGVVHEESSNREVLLGGVQQIEGDETRHLAIS